MKFRPSGDPPEGRRGAILFTAILVLTVLSVFAVSVVAFALSRDRWVRVELERAQAFYLAEAALGMSLRELQSGFDEHGDGLGTIPPLPLGPGSLRAVHDARRTAVTAEGQVAGVRRVLQLTYEAI